MLARLSFPIHDVSGGDASSMVWALYGQMKGKAFVSRGRDISCLIPTGWPEAVTHLRLPQNVACGFPALRSSEVASQHGDSL